MPKRWRPDITTLRIYYMPVAHHISRSAATNLGWNNTGHVPAGVPEETSQWVHIPQRIAEIRDYDIVI